MKKTIATSDQWYVEISAVPDWVVKAANKRHSRRVRFVIYPEGVVGWQVKLKRGFVDVKKPKKVKK